tara:strand:+ start:1177 stop:1356 length:180 start_codon:yes stop_codon:yes gene_type:complete
MKKMNDKNPDYVSSRRSYNKQIATRCRLCGGQLLDPLEARKETHDKCLQGYKKTMYKVK